MMDDRPSTSADARGRRSSGPKMHDSLQRSQLNLAAALLDTASKGTQLTEGQKAEVRPGSIRGAMLNPMPSDLVGPPAPLAPDP